MSRHTKVEKSGCGPKPTRRIPCVPTPFRPTIELLEDRLALSWSGIPPSSVRPALAQWIYVDPAVSVGDGIINYGEADLYRLRAPMAGMYTFEIHTPASEMDSVLGVYRGNGRLLAYSDNGSHDGGTDSHLHVMLRGGKRYVFGVSNRTGSPDGLYTWFIEGPQGSPDDGDDDGGGGGTPPVDDAFEDNDTMTQAIDLGLLTSARTITGLALQDAADWFRFTMAGAGNSTNYAQISFQNQQGTLNLHLRDADGILVASADGTMDTERLSLDELPAGTYYLEVLGWKDARSPAYALEIDPGVGGGSGDSDDFLEDNDAMAQAADLGSVTAAHMITDLVMIDGDDWYRFASSGSSGTVSITSSYSDRDLDMRLYDAAGNSVDTSESATANEQVELAGAGVYFVHVYGWNGAQCPNYTLEINPIGGDGGGEPGDDSFEDNDTSALAADLGAIASTRTIPELVMIDGNDWFRFDASGSAGTVSISSTYSDRDLDLKLYDAFGNLIDTSESSTPNEQVTLSGAGVYLVHVYGWNGAQCPDYTLEINLTGGGGGGGGGGEPGDDAYENNDTMSLAADLGDITGTRAVPGLVMLDVDDWFRFETSTSGGTVSTSSAYSDRDLDVKLYDAYGNLIDTSETPMANELVTLTGSGVYYVHVYGWNGAQCPDYTLTINPSGGSGGGGGGNKTLYMNFDGATIPWADLQRWAADWDIGANHLDQSQNGITVQPFLQGQSNREQVITSIINLMQADLQAFGITVVRHTGLAVEGEGASTTFVGWNDVDVPQGVAGVAGDVDWTNDNATDICFALPPEQFGGYFEQLDVAMADLILHETGHTWGLYHVNSPYTTEAMGLGYSQGTTLGVDASYHNSTYPEFIDQQGNSHGNGRGPQNSHQHMQQVFGNGNYYWDGDTHNTPGFHYHTWAELAGGSHHPDDGTEHHHPGGDAAHHHHDEHVHRDRSSASRFIVPIEIAPTEDEDVVVRGESRRAGISPTCAQATFLDVRTFPRAVEAEDYTTTVPTNDERSVVDALFDSDWADVLPSLV